MTLFKYTDPSGAKCILDAGTILFSSPLRLNDPFDVSVQMLFAYDPIATLENIQDEFNNIVCSPNPWPSNNGSQTSQAAALLHQCMMHVTPEQREAIRRNGRGALWNVDSLRESNVDMLNKIKTIFETEGIFCGSKRYDNQLLWAHYAKEHTGVVFEFEPNFEKESPLKLAESVQYTSARPILYETPKDFVEKALFYNTKDILHEYNKRITMTKSSEWKHEEELRVCIPMYVNTLNGELSRTHKFHNEELRSIYLGCRMKTADRDEIIRLTKQNFPGITIYQMTQDPKEYKLNVFCL